MKIIFSLLHSLINCRGISHLASRLFLHYLAKFYSFKVLRLLGNVQLQFELKPRVEKSQLIVQQKAVPKGLKMEVEVPKPTTKELSYYELQQLQRVQAVETQRQEYKMQVLLQSVYSDYE